MSEFLSIILLGVALSMDTFSVSLSIGTLSPTNKSTFLMSFLVGIMHFIMPLLGLACGIQFIQYVPVSVNKLVSIILLLIAITMIKSLYKEENYKVTNLNIITIFFFALSVSVDSFSTGIGLQAISQKYFLAPIIFSCCSFLFTYIGLIIGKYSYKNLGKISTIIGIFLLIIIALIEWIR